MTNLVPYLIGMLTGIAIALLLIVLFGGIKK